MPSSGSAPDDCVGRAGGEGRGVRLHNSAPLQVVGGREHGDSPPTSTFSAGPRMNGANGHPGALTESGNEQGPVWSSLGMPGGVATWTGVGHLCDDLSLLGRQGQVFPCLPPPGHPSDPLF